MSYEWRICPKCGRHMTTNMYWRNGKVITEWYCPRCDSPVDKYSYYSTNKINKEGNNEEQRKI